MQSSKPTHVRYLILLMLFLVTTINYADRATIAIAGSSLQKDLGIDAVTLGYIFSAFGWAYVAGQIPGGWLLDRFGSKKSLCPEHFHLVAVHRAARLCR